MTSIVIPAHNEEKGIARLLGALGLPGAAPFEVIVVANGCSDATGDVSRKLGATVIETEIASKIHALAVGDAAAKTFPRLYVDADVVIHAADVEALCNQLGDGVHAAGPERVLPMDGVRLPVRWYYDIWNDLPGVRAELYGRGVIAVDRTGHERLAGWPAGMSDDKFVAMSFSTEERAIVREAQVTIMPPKSYRDLLRRRTRIVTGNAALARDSATPFARDAGSSLRYFTQLARREPRHIPRIILFLGTAALSRGLASRRRDPTGWLRDESSRI